MKPKIKKVDEMTIVGVKGVCRMEHTTEDVPIIWNKILEEGHKIQHKIAPNIAYGIQSMIDKDNFYTLAGFEVRRAENVPPEMVCETTPEMRIAIFTYKGKMEDLHKFYSKIMEEWLPANKLKVDWNKPVIEMYDDRFREGNPESEFEIWMPIK